MNMTRFMKYYIFSILIGIIAHNNNVSIKINDCDIRRNINNTTILRTNRLLLAESSIEENVTGVKELETPELEESKVKKSKNLFSFNKRLCAISEGIKYTDKRLYEELEKDFISSIKGRNNDSIHDIKNKKSFKFKVAYSKFMIYYLMSLITLVTSPLSVMFAGFMLHA